VSEFVTDTHALYWHLASDPRLSDRGREIFAAADRGMHRIFVPGIALIEMEYLVERGRLAVEAVDRLLGLLATPRGSYAVAGLD
jgi:PIN domain nuclease of toxin-antitoxin system